MVMNSHFARLQRLFRYNVAIVLFRFFYLLMTRCRDAPGLQLAAIPYYTMRLIALITG